MVAREMTVDGDFESGNVDAVRINGSTIEFSIRPDTESTDRQWFFFRVCGAKDRALLFRLNGISQTNIPIHWKYARPVTSSDGGASYSRVTGCCAVEEAADVFTFADTPVADEQYYAFHYPYGFEQNLRDLARWSQHPAVSVDVIGASVLKRPIHRMRIADGPLHSTRPGVWITCRQHAGETVASFFLSGFLDWLLSKDPAASALRNKAVIHIVPMLNPDGVVAGNYRDNIRGVNLNRVWNDPSEETSPEILAITSAVEQWLADGGRYNFFTDLHGDTECLAFYAFHAAPTVKPPKYSTPETYHRDCFRFLQDLAERNTDFTTREGATELEDPGISRQYMTWRYGVLGLLFENGYSFLDYGPQAGVYVSPDRHKKMGASYGETLAAHILKG